VIATLAPSPSPPARGGDWRALIGVALALALVLVASVALAAPKFPELTGRVVDNAQLLSPETEQKLTDQLAGLEQQTGRQLVVVTLPDLQGYEIEEYGYQLGRAWQIGRKGEDDGALLIVAPTDRKVRIEVGYGLEGVLTDALSSVILQRAVLPEFRAGRFEQGVVNGTNEIVAQLALPDDQAKANVAQAAAQPKRSNDGPPVHLIIVILVIFFILSRVLGGGRGRGRRRRYGGLPWIVPIILSGGGRHDGWGGGGGFGGGGFGGGGGSFGGGGSSGSW
jgi:uncharacterized protein